MLKSRQRCDRHRCVGPSDDGRFCRPLVRQCRLWPLTASSRRPPARCASCPMPPAVSALASEPAIRLAAEVADRAPATSTMSTSRSAAPDAVDSTIRFIRYYYHAPGKPHEGSVHLPRTGLSRFVHCRRRPDRASGLSMPASACRRRSGNTRFPRITPIAAPSAPIRRRSSPPRCTALLPVDEDRRRACGRFRRRAESRSSSGVLVRAAPAG